LDISDITPNFVLTFFEVIRHCVGPGGRIRLLHEKSYRIQLCCFWGTWNEKLTRHRAVQARGAPGGMFLERNVTRGSSPLFIKNMG